MGYVGDGAVLGEDGDVVDESHGQDDAQGQRHIEQLVREHDFPAVEEGVLQELREEQDVARARTYPIVSQSPYPIA